MNDDFVLKIRHVSKHFGGSHALRDVSFQVRRGCVHALCGENGAGKSTLMKILSGELQKDSGEILLNNNAVTWYSPKESLRGGIAIIAQELNPIFDMSIAENIYLGREPTFGKYFVNKKLLHYHAEMALQRLGLRLDVSKKMRSLSLAQIQLVEIAKAISWNSDVLIMDEPTSAIGEEETKILFDITRKLKEARKTIIYISHRMKEIFTIADAFTVLRDGAHIITKAIAGLSEETMISHMIGKKVHSAYFVKLKPLVQHKELLVVRNARKKGVFHNVEFSVHENEILGFFGLMGSGRSEVLKTLFGITTLDSGEVYLQGTRLNYTSPRKVIKAGIGCVTEDRKASGLVLEHSVRENGTLPSLASLCYKGFIHKQAEKKCVSNIIRRFNIKVHSHRQEVWSVSGGNQQKIVFGKWILAEPRILFLDEPTRGVDIGAKQEIYQFMNDYVRKGNAIIMVSSELPEMLAMSHRVLIFNKGHIVAQRTRAEFNQAEFMHLAS